LTHSHFVVFISRLVTIHHLFVFGFIPAICMFLFPDAAYMANKDESNI